MSVLDEKRYTYAEAAGKAQVSIRTLKFYANEVPPNDPRHLNVQRFRPARIGHSELERWIQARTR